MLVSLNYFIARANRYRGEITNKLRKQVDVLAGERCTRIPKENFILRVSVIEDLKQFVRDQLNYYENGRCIRFLVFPWHSLHYASGRNYVFHNFGLERVRDFSKCKIM